MAGYAQTQFQNTIDILTITQKQRHSKTVLHNQRDHQRKEGRGLPFFVCIQLLSDDLRRLDSNTLVFDTPSTALRHDRSAKAGYAPLSACPVIGIRNRAVRTADG